MVFRNSEISLSYIGTGTGECEERERKREDEVQIQPLSEDLKISGLGLILTLFDDSSDFTWFFVST